ncbi:MAG: hypothetical protein JWQ35_651 [Bacteriovoracaceae bacterium]|nr:hypothetical protein [Bacteriovoracaceae bacterium]
MPLNTKSPAPSRMKSLNKFQQTSLKKKSMQIYYQIFCLSLRRFRLVLCNNYIVENVNKLKPWPQELLVHYLGEVPEGRV